MRTDSECYKALNGNAIGTLDQYTGYTDVPAGHWAYAAIQAVTEADLMHGNDVKFEPDAAITGAEVAAVMVRLLDIDTSAIAPPDGAPWYYVETTAAQKAGLMEGLGSPIEYAAPMTREDAMQVLANALMAQGQSKLTEAEIQTHLSPVRRNQGPPMSAAPRVNRSPRKRSICKSLLACGTSSSPWMPKSS